MIFSKSVWLLILLGLAGVILLQPAFLGPESYFYQAHAESVTDDGDLNIANQLLDQGMPLPVFVSNTLNYPSFHNHGGVVVWVPFVFMAKLLSWMGADYGIGRDAMVSYLLSLSSYVCGILTLLILYQTTLRITGCKKSSLLSVLAMFAGTPMGYYALIEPGQANSVALLVSSILLFALFELNLELRWSWVLLGALLALCHIIKIDLWPMTGFVGLLLFYRWRTSALSWHHLVCFCGSFLLLYSFKMENDFMRYGGMFIKEMSMVNSQGFYLFPQLFSPYRGYFYYSPLYLFSVLAGFWALLFRRDFRKDISGYPGRFILISMILIIWVKLFLVSFRFNWNGGTFGGRILMTEIPFFAVFIAIFLEGLSKNKIKLVIAMIVGMVSWNMLKIAEFNTNNEVVFYVWDNLSSLDNIVNFVENEISIIEHFINSIGIIANPEISVKKMLIALSSLVLLTPFIYFIVKQSNTKKIYYFTGYCTVAYIMISMLNMANNGTNSKRLAMHIQDGSLQIISPQLYVMEENMSSLNESISYYRFTNNKEKEMQLVRLRNELVAKTDDNYRKARPELFDGPDFK